LKYHAFLRRLEGGDLFFVFDPVVGFFVRFWVRKVVGLDWRFGFFEGDRKGGGDLVTKMGSTFVLGMDGTCVGNFDAMALGINVGDLEGNADGWGVGDLDGKTEGINVAATVKGICDGLNVGDNVGWSVGLLVGYPVGEVVGVSVGLSDGISVGIFVGKREGILVGVEVGIGLGKIPVSNCTLARNWILTLALAGTVLVVMEMTDITNEFGLPSKFANE
jgi:hypothetical protein